MASEHGVQWQLVQPRLGRFIALQPIRERPASGERGAPELVYLGQLGRMGGEPRERALANRGVGARAAPTRAGVANQSRDARRGRLGHRGAD